MIAANTGNELPARPVPPGSGLQAASVLSPGAALQEQKTRRERSRRLRLRLEHIARELRNMHLEEVTAELTNLPEIILQARQARDSLDSFIALLDRVQLDAVGPMEAPPS
jgi:hypothetical protein